MSVTKKRKQRRLLKTWCVCKNKKMTGFKWNTLFEPDLKFMGKNLYILITIIWCCAVMNSNLRTFFAVFRDALLITIITPACSSLHQLLLYPARLKPIPTLSLNQCWDIREGQSSRNYFFLFFFRGDWFSPGDKTLPGHKWADFLCPPLPAPHLCAFKPRAQSDVFNTAVPTVGAVETQAILCWSSGRAKS